MPGEISRQIWRLLHTFQYPETPRMTKDPGMSQFDVCQVYIRLSWMSNTYFYESN